MAAATRSHSRPPLGVRAARPIGADDSAAAVVDVSRR
jgi:hypothetical protein